MTRISLVRHGQTDWNLARRIQGSSDIPLNETGRRQAEATGDLLAGRHWDGIFSSPLSRAFETAQLISERAGLGEPVVIPEIAERQYGEAEGLTGEEILRRFPEQAVVPGRESRDAVVRRALPALLELAATHDDQSLIVVSHGGVIGSLVRHATGRALPAPGEIIPNGSVHDFIVKDGIMLLDRFNRTGEDRDLFTSVVS